MAALMMMHQAAWPKTDEMETVKAVMPEAGSFKEKNSDGIDYFEAMDGGKLVGYCIVVDAAGYAGTIKAVVGLGTDGMIKNVKVLEHRETPGIGSKIESRQFLKQFEGKSAGDVAMKKGIDAISGATISSGAVIEAIDKMISKFLSSHPPHLNGEHKMSKR